MVIHPTVEIADDTLLTSSTSIGHFSIIGIDSPEHDPVVIGDDAVIRSHVVIYRGTSIGARSVLGHGVLLRENCSLGSDVSVGSHSVIEHSVEIADRVRLHSNCFVPELSILEEGAWLGPGVIVTNARYPNRPDTKANLEGVTVGKGAVVGAGALLLPGVRVGAGALVGAGAVVVDNVPDNARVVGNPARIL